MSDGFEDGDFLLDFEIHGLGGHLAFVDDFYGDFLLCFVVNGQLNFGEATLPQCFPQIKIFHLL